MRLRTVGQFHLVLESCCADCILPKLGLIWVVCMPGTLQNLLLCISHVPCGEYSSSFLAYPQHQIAASLFFDLRPQWTFEHELYMLSKAFPFSHQISTIPIKFRIAWRSIHFTVHPWTYLASYGFCSSGWFWTETLPTSDNMLYHYVGEHIKPKQPCGGTCFIQQRSPLFLQ